MKRYRVRIRGEWHVIEAEDSLKAGEEAQRRWGVWPWQVALVDDEAPEEGA